MDYSVKKQHEITFRYGIGIFQGANTILEWGKRHQPHQRGELAAIGDIILHLRDLLRPGGVE